MKKRWVFSSTIVIILAFVVWAIVWKENFSLISNEINDLISKSFGWWYLIVMLFFVLFSFVIAFSRYGNIVLGEDDAKPEYSTLSWFAMLFCAGMGVGLVFWSISEPISHYAIPREGIEAFSTGSAEFAFKSTFMHWGVHAWACYGVIGLAIAYFQFKKGLPAMVSSILFGFTRVCNSKSIGAQIIDVLAAFATVAGIVTSLGLGVLQINSGLQYLFDIPNNLSSQIIIILIITAVFICSATTGINRGVKLLSNINLFVALFLLIFLFFVGPKVDMLNNLVNGIGGYLNDFFYDSLSLNTYGDTSWTTGWRVFYWAWWIAWAPFVGLFIARISRGRTIRQFILGVVLVPTIASIIWFSIFGTLGISISEKGILSSEEVLKVASNPETGLFIVLEYYPYAMILSVIAIMLLLVFFVTSADSGTFVLASLTSEGEMEPSSIRKIIWGILLACLTIALLIVGGLKPLQTISIIAALPFSIVMVLGCVSLIKDIKFSITANK